MEEMLLERGIDISYETIRRWVAKFGPAITRGLRRRQSRPGDIWHLDEVVVTIKGRKFWLCVRLISMVSFWKKSFRADAIRQRLNVCLLD